MTGPLSAALRHEPTLRMAQTVLTEDKLRKAMRVDATDEANHKRHTQENQAKELARFFLDEKLISFETKTYHDDLVTFATMWIVAPDSPNLEGRKRDQEDARLRGRAEAAREILDAFQDYSQFPQTYAHWATKAHDIIGVVEDKFHG